MDHAPTPPPASLSSSALGTSIRRGRLLARGGVSLVAVVLLSGTAGLLLATSPAAAQDRVDQRRTSGADRVQPSRAPGQVQPGSPTTRRTGARLSTQYRSQFRGGQNPLAPDPGLEFRRRNAIVTGDVADGRGFRGNVGYSAPFDFRGDGDESAFGVNALGSDDLYRFRAESLFSDPRLVTLGVDLRFGDVLGELEVYRGGRGASAADLQQSGREAQRFPDPTTRPDIADRIGDLRRLVDATALGGSLDRYIERTGAPTPVGVVVTPGVPRRRYDASQLGGLSVAMSDLDLRDFGVPTIADARDPYRVSRGLSALDQARLIEDARRGRSSGAVGEAFRDSFVDTRVDANDRMNLAQDARLDVLAPTQRVGDEAPDDAAASMPAWQRIREEIARRYASDERGGMVVEGTPSEDELRGLETDLDRLRQGLGASPGSTASPDASGAGRTPTFPRGDAEEEEDEEDRPAVGDPLDISRIGRSLRHGQRIDALVSPEDRSRAGELIGDAEQELRRGDYFRAERTFTRALRMVPGHPTATVGLAHARLGAGLYIPASLVIRDLFTYQPEMIGARYGEGIVPNRPRLLRALETLRGRVSDERDASDTGLLLAYLGRLLERPEVVREGLGVMRTADAEDRLLVLLEAVWIEGPLSRESDG